MKWSSIPGDLVTNRMQACKLPASLDSLKPGDTYKRIPAGAAGFFMVSLPTLNCSRLALQPGRCVDETTTEDRKQTV